MLVLLAAWQVFAQLSANRLVPTLPRIADRLWQYTLSGDLWFHGRATMLVGLLGLALACLVGVPLGLVMARNRWIDAAVEPLLSATYAAPRVALYPAFALVLGIGTRSQVTLVALECAYPIVYQVYAGARGVDRKLLWVARNAAARRWLTVWQVTLPGCLPALLTGIRIAVPIMLILVTLSEMIGASRGLGFLLVDAQSRFQPAGAMAVLVALAALGFVLDRIVVLVHRRALFWQDAPRLRRAAPASLGRRGRRHRPVDRGPLSFAAHRRSRPRPRLRSARRATAPTRGRAEP